ncbi:hypothetical protein KCU88_g787, partial [Aureobasidium melanogenum]
MGKAKSAPEMPGTPKTTTFTYSFPGEKAPPPKAQNWGREPISYCQWCGRGDSALSIRIHEGYCANREPRH